jgi:hypothetical protein
MMLSSSPQPPSFGGSVLQAERSTRETAKVSDIHFAGIEFFLKRDI